MKKLVKLFLLSLTLLILLCGILLFVLSVWNAKKSESWSAKPEPLGRLIDVNGLKLFAAMKGEGKPIVIFDGDAGSSSSEWLPVFNTIPQTCTSLIYDRAGYGKSYPGRFPRTPELTVRELTDLLREVGLENGPFVLVGQGMGAFYLQIFASANRNKVKALILSQPYSTAWPDFREKIDPVIYKNLLDRGPALKMTSIVGKLGLIRYFRATPYPYVPAEIKEPVMENYSKAAALDAMYSEYKNGPLLKENISNINIALPAVPVTVIHHSPEKYRREMMKYYLAWNDLEDIEAYWTEMLKAITRQTPYGKIIYAKKSISYIHMEEPEIITNAILEVLEK